jgi:hypothetical protein
MSFEPKEVSPDEVQNGLDLLWAYTVETEGRCKDPITKHTVSQTYDYFNRIGYTNHRPRWES